MAGEESIAGERAKSGECVAREDSQRDEWIAAERRSAISKRS
jgi:hypothetical protein